MPSPLIDKVLVDAAFERQKERFPTVTIFGETTSGERLYAACRKSVSKLPPTIAEFYDQLSDDVGHAYDFGMLLGVAAALPKSEPIVRAETVDHPFAYGKAAHYCGDLHVHGDFAFSRDVVVMGDLIVDGTIVDESELCVLLVSGSVRAKTIGCGHRLWSGGKIESELIVVTEGSLYAEQGIFAETMVVVGYGTIDILSPVTAKNYISAKMLEDDEAASLARLRTLFAPSVFGEGAFDAHAAIDLARRGQSWRA